MEKREKTVENIRAYGVYHDTGAKRHRVLAAEIGLPLDRKAEYVFLSGCLPPETMPQVFEALKGLLDRFEVTYTFLSKELCCGWLPLLQPLVMAREDEVVIGSMKEMSQELIRENIKRAEALGAKAVVTICSACEPNYANLRGKTGLEIIHYTEFLARYFKGGNLDLKADYYSGCYRFRRRITSVPFDFDPATSVLQRIEGLALHHVDNKLCCYIPPHMESILKSIDTSTVITTCTGCYSNLRRALVQKGDCQVRMLPEVVWEAFGA